MIDAEKFSSVFPLPLNIHAWTPVELQRGGYDRQQYTLLSPFVFNGPNGPYNVPQGFQTDFASIPRAAFWYIDPEDPVILYASVPHDWGYSNGGRVSSSLTLTRDQLDQGLAFGMDVSGARWDQKRIVYSAVRVGGGSHWAPPSASTVQPDSQLSAQPK